MINRIVNARIALPAGIALVLGLLLATVVVVGTNESAKAQDVTCVEGMDLLDDDVTCEGPLITTRIVVCDTGVAAELDNGAEICQLNAELVAVTACPLGYAPDDLLGGVCARFEPADQMPDRCPEGSRGEPGDCYIGLAKLPRGQLVCDGDGVLAGDICVVEGAPPIRGEGTCPSGIGIIDSEEGCYRLVSRDAAGECPSTSTEVDGECREAEELIPGALQCETGFGLVGGRCIAQSAADIPAAECPVDSTEDAEGVCRRPVADASGAFFCKNPTAALNGKSCVSTAPFVEFDEFVCPDGFEVIVTDALCLTGPMVVDEYLSCEVGIVDAVRKSCVLRLDGPECPVGAVLLGEATCVLAAQTSTQVGCAIGQGYLAGAGADPECVTAATVRVNDVVCPDGSKYQAGVGGGCVQSTPAEQQPDECPAGAAGEPLNCYEAVPRPGGDAGADCPAGTQEDADGLCRAPVETLSGTYFCADATQLLVGATCLALVALDVEANLVCVSGELIADIGLCRAGAPELVAESICSRTGAKFDQRGFCTFELDYATILLTKTLTGDGPDETFVVTVKDVARQQPFLIAAGETVEARVLIGAITINESTPDRWRLSEIACNSGDAVSTGSLQVAVTSRQILRCEISNQPAAASLTVAVELDADSFESPPGTFAVRVLAQGGDVVGDLQIAPGSAATIDVVSGQSFLVADFPLGWRVSAVACGDDDGQNPFNVSPFNVIAELQPGGAQTCTFVASPATTSTVRLTKQVANPADAADVYTFRITDLVTSETQTVDLKAGESYEFDANPGAQSITELRREGSQIVSAECTATSVGGDSVDAAVGPASPGRVQFGVNRGSSYDCSFVSTDVATGEVRFVLNGDGPATTIPIVPAVDVDGRPFSRDDADYEVGIDAGSETPQDLNPGTYAFYTYPVPGFVRSDLVCTGVSVIEPFDGLRVIATIDANATATCSVAYDAIANAPQITLVRELDGRDASPDSGFAQIDEIAITHEFSTLSLTVGTPLTVDGWSGRNRFFVAEADGWRPAEVRCVDSEGTSIGEGLDQAFMTVDAGTTATCTFSSRLISQADGAVEIIELESTTPTPTNTPAPTPTPAATASDATAAISYPAGGFSPTATPGEQVPALVTALQAPSAQATDPLAATGTTTSLLLALATALLGIGATLYVGARRAD